MQQELSHSSTVVISAVDRRRLRKLLASEKPEQSHASTLLHQKLALARILAPEAMPPDVVTMNSRVLMLEIDSQAEYGFTLSYPWLATDPGNISVLAPVGAAVLGLARGQEIYWRRRSGRLTGMRVLTILYQPEACGDFDL
ncbi:MULTISPECIES: nucleoside diphosphate kinase regulator [Oxalobacteraceae]|uniref:nucleoside diphosphate kinase regulator n=1 Tax=Oxalobacteraceae TaxID=75682 RepID=UPI001455E130|nr:MULTISPECIES: nucleoside diphosphate kinase regulator [Oxalobacteraceae]